MSVLTRITRFLGFGSARLQSAGGPRSIHAAQTMDPPRRTAKPTARPREPVRVEIEREMPIHAQSKIAQSTIAHTPPSRPSSNGSPELEDEDARAESAIEQATLPSAPKNKQELLAELRRNYAEAVHLIRKVDSHLDAQARRSDRMLDLAERAPEGVEHLGAIRAAQGELAELTRSIRDAAREGLLKDEARMERQRDILERQAGTLGRIEVLFEQSSNLERELGSALAEFRTAIAHMSASNHRLGGAIELLDQRERSHEQRLDAISERGRTVTNALIILCGLAVATAVATAMVAVMGMLYLITR